MVLNLIITGIPSILRVILTLDNGKVLVLNLIITGIPSIPFNKLQELGNLVRFKPYYNWNTFNTKDNLFFSVLKTFWF